MIKKLYNLPFVKNFFIEVVGLPAGSTIVKLTNTSVDYTFDFKTFYSRVNCYKFTDLPLLKMLWRLILLNLAVLTKGMAFALFTDTLSANNGDVFLDKNTPTGNHAGTNIMELRESTTLTRRGLVSFTLSSGPGTISDISLFVQDTGTAWSADTIGCYKCTRVFTETGATWNSYDGTNNWTTAGGDFDVTALSTVTSGTALQVQQFALNTYSGGITWGTVTQLMLKWANDQVGALDVAFVGKGDPTPSKRPYVKITYTGGPHNLSLTGAGT